MTIAILATGDEIIHGDTLNTNTHAIARGLCSEGLSLGYHLSCSDKEQEMIDCMDFLCRNHSIIILIGGLGPTSDDRTRFALARFLNIKLLEFPEAIAHIEARLTRANLSLNAGNRQQALFPVGATLLPNPQGTAMGCHFYWQNKQFILLPGPPRECLPMFNDYVLPVVAKQEPHSQKQILKWRLFGVAEGAIAEILDNALANEDCETGYRLEVPYLEFKVRCHPADIERVKQIIDPLVTPLIIAPPEQKASERLCQKIEQRQQPIVILDDVTGGLLQTLIQRPGTYPWLTFHENGNSTLHFHLSGLEEYWLKKTDRAITAIKIDFHTALKQGSESHQIPYFSPLVVDFAAEWLSFRLFHLIDQLHQ